MRFALAAMAALALAAGAGAARANVVDFTTMQLNGSATASANDLNLGDGNGGLAFSAFLPGAIASGSSFTSSFRFTLVNNGFMPHADGVAFVIQNDPAGASALGVGGGSIGADGIANAVGIAFQSWDNNHATIFDSNTGVYGGSQPLGNFNLGDQDDDVTVTVQYIGHVLSFSASNASTGVTVSDSLAIDLSTLGPQVYLGFTGGSGLSYAFQDITDWDLDVTAPAAVPEPGAWALMILGFAGAGAAARVRRRQGLALA